MPTHAGITINPSGQFPKTANWARLDRKCYRPDRVFELGIRACEIGGARVIPERHVERDDKASARCIPTDAHRPALSPKGSTPQDTVVLFAVARRIGPDRLEVGRVLAPRICRRPNELGFDRVVFDLCKSKEGELSERGDVRSRFELARAGF